eukprot:14966385-Alexandrium_andersonii.AAC.1
MAPCHLQRDPARPQDSAFGIYPNERRHAGTPALCCETRYRNKGTTWCRREPSQGWHGHAHYAGEPNSRALTCISYHRSRTPTSAALPDVDMARPTKHPPSTLSLIHI